MGSHRVGHDWSDLAAAAAASRTSKKSQWLGLSQNRAEPSHGGVRAPPDGGVLLRQKPGDGERLLWTKKLSERELIASFVLFFILDIYLATAGSYVWHTGSLVEACELSFRVWGLPPASPMPQQEEARVAPLNPGPPTLGVQSPNH